MNNTTINCRIADIPSIYNAPAIIITSSLGLVANVLALWIFCFYIKSWKPNTVFSLNLAIADLMLAVFCLPFRADYFVRGKNWVFGDAMCRINLFLFSLNRAASIAFLMVMAMNRYFKVMHPYHRVSKISVLCAVKVSCLMWAESVAITAYLLAERHDFKYNKKTLCETLDMDNSQDTASVIWHNVVFIFFKFTLPTCVLLFSTLSIVFKLRQMSPELRHKYRKTIKLLAAVAIVFVLCFLPTSVTLIAVVVHRRTKDLNCRRYTISVQVFYNTLFVTYFNIVLDPIVYYFSSSMFQTAFRRALNTCRSGAATDTEAPSQEGELEDKPMKRSPVDCQTTETFSD
ncbi:hydroxycarboxylic acid receptor 3-like [Callorhinchus milii]|uniref:hydroxycarboxylic acid receptor 3-like n=1 Tax=Callorhinchus milii TaxID=7868 RepID=UPI001C3F92CA|nr:hydroxycarboxylic acid receptor 3-like [Callorhinchus milii]